MIVLFLHKRSSVRRSQRFSRLSQEWRLRFFLSAGKAFKRGVLEEGNQ